MCGFIAGFSSVEGLDEAVKKALVTLEPRGPDDEGFWSGSNVSLAHKRLAILDLDHRAFQPMESFCERYVIVFNGEIYNFKALRDDLAQSGSKFKTESDTEVLLELFVRHGEKMLHMLHGMFAFVIWDKESNAAFVARDPYGIKPLYVAKNHMGVFFASQVKALLATGLVSSKASINGQMGFWLLGSVPEPYTWFEDIRAVPSGHCGWVKNSEFTTKKWFDFSKPWCDSPTAETPEKEIKSAVRNAIKESVQRHLVTDVPIGVFLSGGIDSGALAGLMKECGVEKLQGITIAYEEFAGTHEDEAPIAAEIAKYYGIQHHIRTVTKDEFLADLPKILNAMDQPTIDGINTWYASKAVSELGLKVVVSGVGGDELFQGYDSFNQLPKLTYYRNVLSYVPGFIALGRLLGKVMAQKSGNNRWEYAIDWLSSISGAWWLRRSVLSPKDVKKIMHKSADALAMLESFSVDDFVGAMSGILPLDKRLALSQIESSTYLRNQLLRDSDWSSMNHSVELRTPLVDAHLLESLQPWLGSFRHFPKKALLAGAPSKPLPRSILERKKTGFYIPVNNWIKDSVLTSENVSKNSWQVYVADHYQKYADSLNS